ncbi:MAG TPA: amino acid adenylation domain-containing protein, partial [Thermoanaerobaculia bacterium]|nr:amino acid adenylation domain-containing protein [Thermoanaerobaculia bacterium]
MPADLHPLTFPDLLRARSAAEPQRPACTFLADGEEVADRLSYGELDAWARGIAARLLAEGPDVAGERALLLFPPGLEFVAAFLGCLYAGVVAVPAYPPRPGRKAGRLEAIAADARPRFALTTAQIAARWGGLAADSEALGAVRCLQVPERGEAVPVELPRIGPETLAFLQYTSGSTATPKGVEVRHSHLLFMERLIGEVFEQGPESVVVGWLPLYHDMGLIRNLLQPLYAGAHCVLMSPVAFLRRPRRWLEAISRFRGTTSGGPSFAYELCAERIGAEERAGLDLSSWRVAFNGAEPVRAATLAHFAEAFAACGFRAEASQPCYGLAEATLLVSGVRSGRGPRVLSVRAEPLQRGRIESADPEEAGERKVDLVGCGAVPSAQRVEIVNPVTLRRSAPGQVGEIWVAGPGVCSGYWRRPEETARDFDARIAGPQGEEPDGPFLRTGDLGFLADGELFVTGRFKDLIILRGRNLYPQDVEWTAEHSAPELAVAGGAAFSVEVDGEERLVVAHEVKPRVRLDHAGTERLAAAVRRAVAEEHEAQVYEVVLLAPGALPKTSSGKVQRRECRKLYLAGELESVGRSRLDAETAAEPEAALSREGLLALPAEERRPALARELRQRAAAALGVTAAEMTLEQPLLDLGLDSLAAIDLIHGVGRDFGVDLPLEALFEGASCAVLAEQLLSGLDAPRTTTGPADPHWTGLSYGERALWLLEGLLPPEDASYRLAAAARLPSPIQPSVLRAAFQTLVDRHEALRTTYPVDKESGEPVRRVVERLDLDFAERDATGWTAERLAREIESEAWRPFDLARGPLLRVSLFTGTAEGPVLLVAVHHIVADFGSLALLASQLRELTAAGGGALSRAAGEGWGGGYSAFARRQAAELEGSRGEELWAWWRERLADLPSSAALPYDRAPEPGEILSGPAGVVRLDFGPQQTERLLALARAQRVTPYAALLALQAALLSRITGETDLTVGAPAAGRPAGWPEAPETVGYFANPLVLRFRLDGDPAFTEILGQARERLTGALAHQDLPLPLLVERLRRERPGAEIEPFRTMLSFYQAPVGSEGLVALALGEAGPPLSLGGLELKPLPLAPRSSQFDFTLSLGLRGGCIGGLLIYHAGRFEAATMHRLAGQLGNLLDGALDRPGGRLSELPLLSEAARHQLVLDANDLTAEAPSWTSLDEGFARQARETPHRTAVVHGNERTTYEELSLRVDRLARHLRKLGLKVEDRVGVLLERTPEMVAALLGVLRSRAAYVPLDPSLPEERLAFLLEDSGASLLITRRGLADRLPYEVPRLLLDEGIPESGEELPRLGDRRRTLAYVIYTSGSTGRPKGVEIEHGSALHLMGWARRTYGDAELAGVLASTSIGFDLSIFELFAPLSFGGTVILADNALALPGLPAATEVTLLNTVPSAMAALLELDVLPPRLSTVNLAGEPLRRSLAERVLGAGVPRLLNLYGPSEDTTYSTGWRVEPGEAGEPPIGRPLAGSRAHVVDAGLSLVPPGVAGELVLGGFGLARGYLGRPELTAERWVPDPFGGEPGSRLYRTGDCVRQRPDGVLVYLGRLDRQLKIRGFRIEPGEVEAALLAHPAVREAAVVRRPGMDTLAAFVALQERVDGLEAELLAALRRRLPVPLVPSSVAVLDALPLTRNGKVDRKALEALAAAGDEGGTAAPPQGETEERLAGIWAELLETEVARIGRENRFFDVGGHSLLAARLVARIRRAFGVELPLSLAFEAPRLTDQARRIEAGRREAISPILRREGSGPQRLSFAQERLWFLDRLYPGQAVYNMP